MNFKSIKIALFLEKNNKTFLFLALSWIIILFSINTGFYSVKNLFFNSTSLNNYLFVNLINSLRWILPILLLPIILKITYNKINYDLFTLNILFITVFYLIHIVVFDRNINLQFSEGPQLNNVVQLFHGPQLLDTINLLICYVVTILIFSYIYQNYQNKILILNVIFFSFICFISLFIFFQMVMDIIKTENLFLYYNYAFKPDTRFFDQPTSRITGWSRLVLVIFMLYFLFNELKSFDKKKYLINLIILLFFSFLIIFAQTRGAIIGYIFLLLFYLSLPQIKLLKKIIIISLFISIPFGLFNFIDIKKIGEHRVDQNRMKTTIENLFNSNDIQSNSIENKNLLNNKKKYEYSVSSGRIEIWKKSINHLIKEKKIFGYGPQGDRYLLTLLAKTFLDSVWGNNSSNAIIYSSISGGVIGLISILLIYVSLFIVFLKCLIKIFMHKTEDLYLISYFSIYCYIIMRSFFENGFAVFGIDFCILIVSYYFINSRLSNISKI